MFGLPRLEQLPDFVLGEEDSCCPKRESHCQSPQQDQSREVPRSGNGKRGEVEGSEKERPSCKIRAGKLHHTFNLGFDANIFVEEGRSSNCAGAERKEMAERSRL